MQIKKLSPAVIAAAMTACAIEAESLNSERIAERFGSYGIDVLSQGDGVRRSSLYSLAGDARICRTYAVVIFLNPQADAVAEAHADILAGQSIGETFKSDQWQINKHTEYLGDLDLDASQSEIGALMHLSGELSLAMHVYRLVLEKNTQAVEYARIVEVHHPEYLDTDALRSLYENASGTPLNAAELDAVRAMVLDAQ